MILIPLVIIVLAPNLHIARELGFFDPHAYNEKRLLEIAALLLLTLVPLLSWNQQSGWQQLLQQIPTRAWVILSAIFILGSLSLQQSALIRMGWNEFGLTFFIFFGTTAVAALRKENHALDTILIFTVTIMAALFFIRFEMFRYLDAPFQHLTPNEKFRHDFTNPRFFNQIQSWVIPLLTLSFLWSRKKLSKFYSLLFILPAASWITLLIFSGSLGPWFGFLVAIVVTGVLFRKQALPWILSMVAATLVGTLIYWFLFSIQIDTAAQTAAQTAERLTSPFSTRLDLWREAWMMSSNHPLLGVSPHHWSYYCDRLGGISRGHPHMSLLQWAAEYGWISTILLLSLMVWAFSSWIKRIKQSNFDDRDLNFRIALTASMLAAATHSLMSGVLVMPLSQFMSVVVIGWMVGIHFSNKPIEKIHWSPVKSIGSLTLILWIGWNFTQSVWPEVRYIINGPHSEMTVLTPSGDFLQPRFWHQGLIPWLQLPSDH